MAEKLNGKKQDENLARFGFSFEKGGAHTSRTMMLQELTLLLSFVDNHNSDKNDYFKAIEEDNCLGKRSGKTRKLTARQLAELYTLDPTLYVCGRCKEKRCGCPA